MLPVALAVLALAPPRIREPFTLLPCPMHPTATIELEGCGEHALVSSDRRIDARAARVFRLLPSGGRAAFVRGERAWLADRRASCDAESSRYAGGTVEPVVLLQCELARNATHLRELAATELALRHPK